MDGKMIANFVLAMSLGGQIAFIFVHTTLVACLQAIFEKETVEKLSTLFFPPDSFIGKIIISIQFILRFIIFMFVVIPGGILAILIPIIAIGISYGYFYIFLPIKKNKEIVIDYFKSNPDVILSWSFGVIFSWCFLQYFSNAPYYLIIMVILISWVGLFGLGDAIQKNQPPSSLKQIFNYIKNQSESQQKQYLKIIFCLVHFIGGCGCGFAYFFAWSYLYDTVIVYLFGKSFGPWDYLINGVVLQ